MTIFWKSSEDPFAGGANVEYLQARPQRHHLPRERCHELLRDGWVTTKQRQTKSTLDKCGLKGSSPIEIIRTAAWIFAMTIP